MKAEENINNELENAKLFSNLGVIQIEEGNFGIF